LYALSFDAFSVVSRPVVASQRLLLQLSAIFFLEHAGELYIIILRRRKGV